MGSYVHTVPGRLRVKTPYLKGQPTACQNVEALLASLSGVADASSNPLTGSLTIHYDADRLEAGDLMEVLRTRHLLDDMAGDVSTVGCGPATKATQAIGKALVNWALGRALEANGLSLLAALI